ncbi:DUF302 domain-containing protein [Thiomicrospira sp. R3]|uniref:DUF302 domain-containing protein n=1 Tax=Thiomicrospira sp. R3 TaxID=3035472 RepID=UPI00259B64A3|nr:DUF302 domain-containing protein [Thiomicrospira sp. R3]WFE69247.1 DUF302 domain-containing protein [Thiomicrospira sp. R3]
MYFIVESKKTFEQACEDLAQAVSEHKFGVLHIHDLGQTLRSKGFEFSEQCRVFEVCNPGQAFKVLKIDMNLNMALPCRISVFSENGLVKIGMIKPQAMLAPLSDAPGLVEIAGDVEQQIIKMIEQAS